MPNTSPHHLEIKIEDFVYDGKSKLTIKPNELKIVWGSDPRYWKPPTENEAELVQVCWLEVTKSIRTSIVENDKIYSLTFYLELKPDAFGWKDSPVRIAVKPGRKRLWKKIDLTKVAQSPSESGNSKMQASIRFKIDPSNKDLEFGLYEIWRGRWKGGLIIREVVLEPTS